MEEDLGDRFITVRGEENRVSKGGEHFVAKFLIYLYYVREGVEKR